MSVEVTPITRVRTLAFNRTVWHEGMTWRGYSTYTPPPRDDTPFDAPLMMVSLEQGEPFSAFSLRRLQKKLDRAEREIRDGYHHLVLYGADR